MSLVHQHGHRYPDRIVIPLSQREIARRYAISPGTLSWYLAELGEAVLARQPHLTLSVTITDAVRPEQPTMQRDRSSDGRTSYGSPSASLDDVVEAVECNNELLRLLLAQFHSPAGRLRERTARQSRTVRAVVARSRSQKEEEIEHLPSFSCSGSGSADSSARAIDARPNRASAARTDRASSSRGGRTAEETMALLEALVVEVEQRRLVPIGNRQHLVDALAPFSDAQIEGAVRRLIDDLRARRPIRSPFGLLIAKAEARDPDLFTPVRSRPSPTGSGVLPPPPESPVEVAMSEADELFALAALAVGEMESDPDRFATDLTRLDRMVEERLAAMPDGMAIACRFEPMMRSFRVEAYRDSVLAIDGDGGQQ